MKKNLNKYGILLLVLMSIQVVSIGQHYTTASVSLVKSFDIDTNKKVEVAKVTHTDSNNILSTHHNPIEDHLTLQVKDVRTKNGSITIYNLMRHAVQTLDIKNINDEKIDTSQLPKGTYIVKLNVRNKVFYQKFEKK